MKITNITWIAIVLTIWATVDLGTRYYAYHQVKQAEMSIRVSVLNACLKEAEYKDPKSYYVGQCHKEANE